MKRTIHFSSIVGRESKFDPCSPQNISIFNAPREAKEPRRLDLETAFSRTHRRPQCAVNLGGHNPRDEAPSPAAEARRQKAAKALKASNPLDAAESSDGDSADRDESEFADFENSGRDSKSRRQSTATAGGDKQKRRKKSTVAKSSDMAVGAMAAFEKGVVSQVRGSPSVSFTRTRRFLPVPGASTPAPPDSSANEMPMSTPVPTADTPEPVGRSKRRVRPEASPWGRAPDRDGLSPARRREQQLAAERRAERSRSRSRSPTGEDGDDAAQLQSDGETMNASLRRTTSAAPSALLATYTSMHTMASSTSPARAEKPRMSTRDVAKAIERHEAGLRGAKGQPASLHTVKGPLFRLDTGRNTRVMGIVQPGVDAAAAALDAELGPEPRQLDPDAAWEAAKGRHKPRANVATAARVHAEQERREQLEQQALALLDPGNVAKRLQQEAARFREDAARVRDIRERKERERQVARRRGDVLTNDDTHKQVAGRSARQEDEALAMAHFFESIDPRADDVRCHEARIQYQLGKSTRAQRDFFLCSVRDLQESTTAVGSLPHINKLAPPPGELAAASQKKDQAKKKQHKKQPAAAGKTDDADAASPAAAVNVDGPTVGTTATQSLPILAQFLGIEPTVLDDDQERSADVADDKRRRRRSRRKTGTGAGDAEQADDGDMSPLDPASLTASPQPTVAFVPSATPLEELPMLESTSTRPADSPEARRGTLTAAQGSNVLAAASLSSSTNGRRKLSGPGGIPRNALTKRKQAVATQLGLKNRTFFSPKRDAVTQSVPDAKPLPC